MSKFYIASDYARVSGGGFSFYYGYEETLDDAWCFVVSKDGKEVMRIPETKLGCRDRFNVVENLLAGISLWLESSPPPNRAEEK